MAWRNTHRESPDYVSTIHSSPFPIHLSSHATLYGFIFGGHLCKHLICIFHLTKVLIFKDCGYLICFLEPGEILVRTYPGTDTDYEGFHSTYHIFWYQNLHISFCSWPLLSSFQGVCLHSEVINIGKVISISHSNPDKYPYLFNISHICSMNNKNPEIDFYMFLPASG